MRIRLALEFSIRREPKPEPEQFEHRDNDGTLIDNVGTSTAGDMKPMGFQPWRPEDD